MKYNNYAFIRNLGLGVSALLVTIPLVYAERPDQSQRGQPTSRSQPAPRNEPVRAPEEHRAAPVDRVNHGSIRHVDTQVVQRPVEVQHQIIVPNTAYMHHDREVDIQHQQYWQGFVYGERRHGLRDGYYRLLVNGSPYYYDGGIYYQQADDDYQTVYPPVGADVRALPDGAFKIDGASGTFYYAGGAFYSQANGGFVIVAPPAGLTVPELPPGAVQMNINGGLAYQFNGVYFQPVFVNGVTQYMTFPG